MAPGAAADIVIVDLRGPHFGAVRDPIKSLVEYGSGSDIDTVIVDGRTLIQGRRALAIDEPALLHAVQESGERTWASRSSVATIIAEIAYPVKV